jgi:hypothetical protein
MTLFLGFLEPVEGLADADPRAAALLAGFLTLCVADMTFIHQEVRGVSVEYARRRVARLHDLTLVARLGQILDAAASAETSEDWQSILAGRCLAYGLELVQRSEPAAAADTFAVVAKAHGTDADVRMQAMRHRAFALRQLARWGDVTLTLSMLKSLAHQQRDIPHEMEADAGLARVHIWQGNIPAAEPAVQAVLAHAIRLEEQEVVGAAYIDLAAIAGIRHDPAETVRYSLLALGYPLSIERTERVRLNLATAERELRHHELAAGHAMQVYASTRDPERRALAGITLCQLAVDVEDWTTFEARAREVSQMPLTPKASAEFQQAIAIAAASRKDWTVAERALDGMLSVAESHGLNELTVWADTARRLVAKRSVPTIYDFRPTPTVQLGNPVSVTDYRDTARPLSHSLSMAHLGPASERSPPNRRQ